MNKCKACEKNMDGWCQDPQFDDARSEFFTGESDCCEVCGVLCNLLEDPPEDQSRKRERYEPGRCSREGKVIG